MFHLLLESLGEMVQRAVSRRFLGVCTIKGDHGKT